jgi:G:T-mismatch repair DNA endonuclease (very short patch repair protein)
MKVTHRLIGRKQSEEHIKKRVDTRKRNNSYVRQGLGHKPTNTKPNSGNFKKGIPHPPKRKYVDLDYCKEKYFKGYSTYDLSKKFSVSQKTIGNRLKEIGMKLRRRGEHTERTKQKIKDTLIKKEIQPKERYSGEVWNKGKSVSENERLRLKQMRAKQILPIKDSSIEIKIQNYLKKLGIEFFTHQYMKIEHGYQCDILIPKQETEGIIIPQKTIIEVDGCYFHGCPICKKYKSQRIERQIESDMIRTKELQEKGFRVIRLWEHEIKVMQLNDFKQDILK